MMIAARLAGGNLFFCLFCGGGAFGSSSEHSDFFEGDFVVGDFWEHSEQLGALGFFFEGICGGGILFFGGWWGVFWIVSVGKN